MKTMTVKEVIEMAIEGGTVHNAADLIAWMSGWYSNTEGAFDAGIVLTAMYDAIQRGDIERR